MKKVDFYTINSDIFPGNYLLTYYSSVSIIKLSRQLEW